MLFSIAKFGAGAVAGVAGTVFAVFMLPNMMVKQRTKKEIEGKSPADSFAWKHLFADEEWTHYTYTDKVQNEGYKDHLVYDALKHEEKVRSVEFLTRGDENIVVFDLGKGVCGHDGIVHGGLIATIIDNTYGKLVMGATKKPAFTANLSIDYRRPLPADTKVAVHSRVESHEGRKIRVSARVCAANKDGMLDDIVFAESTALFITPRNAPTMPDFAWATLWQHTTEFPRPRVFHLDDADKAKTE
ncbi:MAG: hypothetical protein MHM6MM_005241 [Cercozoa sp. M6MM]